MVTVNPFWEKMKVIILLAKEKRYVCLIWWVYSKIHLEATSLTPIPSAGLVLFLFIFKVQKNSTKKLTDWLAHILEYLISGETVRIREHIEL